MNILVGIPAYNEEKNIASLIVKILKQGYKVLVCDDASTDNTAEIAEKLGAKVLQHSKNRGYGASIQTLFTNAKETETDILVTIDADGQHDYNDISNLIKPIQEKNADIVIGSRFLEKKSSIPKYREIGIKVLTKIANSIEDLNISDSQSGFRAYNKKSLESIFPSEDAMGVSTEILIKAAQKNLKIVEVPIIVLYEGDTSTHHPTVHGLSILGTSIKLLSIKHPLMFYGIPGILFLLSGILFTIMTLSSFAETRMIVTNQALLAIGTILVGLILIMTAIILFSIISVVRERR